ncbi:MAG: nucleotidyltransferase domain-containing protein [Elusimicrobiota bacterium]|jgi:predicted nucleotidyltransferase|nr:nucleotidyltransferase domain-containing protein [Elusimicrobiota bacterium]
MAKKSDLSKAARIALEYSKTLKANMKINKMYIFGSYVNGTNHIDSDIDIAVISDDFKGDCIDDGVKLMMFLKDKELIIEPHPFLPQDFNKENPFAKEIIETGIRLI